MHWTEQGNLGKSVCKRFFSGLDNKTLLKYQSQNGQVGLTEVVLVYEKCKQSSDGRTDSGRADGHTI